MKLKKSEADHIKACGGKWSGALAAASLSVRQDARLVGCGKIRESLAFRAALLATGYDDGITGFVVPGGTGPITPEIQKIAKQAFDLAFDAAQAKVRA